MWVARTDTPTRLGSRTGTPTSPPGARNTSPRLPWATTPAPRAAEAARLYGDRSAGASREEIAPKDCRWMKHSSMALQQPELAASGELLGCANRSEASLRFVPPPEGFEARAPTVRRHPCDSSVHIEHGLKVDYLTEMDAQFRDKTQPRFDRSLPPRVRPPRQRRPRGRTHDRRDRTLPRRPRRGSRDERAGRRGTPRTRVPSHHLITGARAALPGTPTIITASNASSRTRRARAIPSRRSERIRWWASRRRLTM